MRKGLNDLRTAITGRVHAKPPQKGTEHLSLYLLDKEAQRLERELAGMKQRERRIGAHLHELRQEMHRLEQEAQQEKARREALPREEVDGNRTGLDWRHCQWRKLAIGY